MFSITSIPRFARIFSDTFRYATLARAQAPKGEMAPPEILHPLMRSWAHRTLSTLRVRITATGEPPSQEPVLFVGNHMSYLDIPLLMAVAPVVFVAKEEVSRWPVVGHACRTVGTVFVNRESRDSRKGAGRAIADSFYQQRHSICVFPSGTTTILEDKPWRWGAFEIAKQYGITVQPFRLCYRPAEKVAFLKQHNLVSHLCALLEEPAIEAHLEFASPIKIRDVEADAAALWAWNRSSLTRKLDELGYVPPAAQAGAPTMEPALAPA